MTPRQCSIHTHSTLCDGGGTLAEMAAAACEAGVLYFGASGHSRTLSPDDAGNTLPADLTEYRGAVLALRERYAGRMEVLLGLEQDSGTPEAVPADLDYWIGSVHELHDPETGRYYAVDWKREVLTACRQELFHGDVSALIGQYYQETAAMAARKPTVLGHIDLITKLNGDGSLFDEDDPSYRRSALEALHAADPRATLLEINTGAIARGYRKAPYPAPFLLREWRRMGGRVILTADAHSADAVVYRYDLAVEAARAAGFAESTLLTMDGPRSCPL